MERGRFGILKKEGDVANAQAAIPQYCAREVGSYVIKELPEGRLLLGQTARECSSAYAQRCGDSVRRYGRLSQMLYNHAADARAQWRVTRSFAVSARTLETSLDDPGERGIGLAHRTCRI